MMVSETRESVESVEHILSAPEYLRLTANMREKISYSVGVMAYNEEANIERTLRALLQQKSEYTHLSEIIVVASGCTDRTVPLVQGLQATEPRIQLIIQERREGKASAINLFLEQVSSSIVVLVGADIIPEQNTLEQLCFHFYDSTVGMVGAHPVPVNDQKTFIGYAVHLLWNLHDRVARHHPKLGEVIAFRKVISQIPADSAVDEISIQALIAQQELRLVYEPKAVVYNKGPMTVSDFLKQRRRIHAGHLRVHAQTQYAASTMDVGNIVPEVWASLVETISSPRQMMWTLGTIALESIARMQGQYDVWRRHSHHVWQAVASTKVLEDEQRKLRRVYTTQSVVVFQFGYQAPHATILHGGRDTRFMQHTLKKLLPIARHSLRPGDILNINGPNTMVGIFTTDRAGIEKIASRLQKLMEQQVIDLGSRAGIKLNVTYHTVSFGQGTN